MFPQYQTFLRKKNISIPPLLNGPFPPWKTRDEFKKADTAALKQWFAETMDLQAEFMIQRLDLSLNKILQKAPQLANTIQELKKTDASLFALIDYLNFKGDGLSSKERYQGKGWGLYQVLLGMDVPTLEAFKASALTRLKERVAFAPAEKNEARWLAGWSNRVKGY